MRERYPMTQSINVSEARKQWSELVNKVARKEARVLVEKSGAPVAALVSTEDLDRLTRWDAEREARFSALDATRAAFADVPDEELEAEVTTAVAAARRQLREERHTQQTG